MRIETTLDITEECAVSYEDGCDPGVCSLLIEWESTIVRLVGNLSDLDSLVLTLGDVLAEARCAAENQRTSVRA